MTFVLPRRERSRGPRYMLEKATGPDDEELVTAAEHKEGAEKARLQAIRWYERILREAPTSVEAGHAVRLIVQITVGIDTGERGFYAVYA